MPIGLLHYKFRPFPLLDGWYPPDCIGGLCDRITDLRYDTMRYLRALKKLTRWPV